MMKSEQYLPGTVIEIKVDGETFLTVIDEHGTQRFICDNILSYLSESGQIDLNQTAIDYDNGIISKRDYMLLNMKIGYSVNGFSDIFPDLSIDNPMWK